MASDRYVLARPIEITASNNTLTVDRGGGAAAVNLTVGVYGCIAMIMDELEDQLKAENAGWTAQLTSDFYVVLANADDFTVVWTDTALRDLLGFTAGLAVPATSFTATMIPENCWLPAKVRADQGVWEPNLKQRFRGVRAQSGIVNGLSTGKVLYETEITQDTEFGYNLLRSKGRSAVEQKRSLETFVDGSRDSYPSTGNVSTGGFYFWKDYTALDEESSMDAGDASTFNYTSGADDYVFCEFDPDWNLPTNPTMGSGHLYYNVKIPIRTAPIPTSGWVTL
jgi:hypothetical protein